MTRAAADLWVDATVAALVPLADPEHAVGEAAYMKNVTPFLGMYTKDRRAAQREAWKVLPHLDTVGVTIVAERLWQLPEREYQYDVNPKSSGTLVEALKDAPQRGWTVVSMKDDWKTIFPD